MQVTAEFIAEYERLVKEVDRLRAKIDNLQGTGISNDYYSLSISIPQVPVIEAPAAADEDVGQYQEMVKKMVTQNRRGWGFMLAHGMT